MGAETDALYTMAGVKHCPSRGHEVFTTQLQVLVWALSVGAGVNILMLWLAMMAPMDFIQLYETLTVDLLNSLWYLDPLGKCLQISCRNLEATLEVTFWLYGGLNHITFLRRCRPFLEVVGAG